jgi:hypothetical protein
MANQKQPEFITVECGMCGRQKTVEKERFEFLLKQGKVILCETKLPNGRKCTGHFSKPLQNSLT